MNKPKRESGPLETGCALALVSFLAVVFFGIMSVGALSPLFAFSGLEISSMSLMVSLIIFFGAILHRRFFKKPSPDRS